MLNITGNKKIYLTIPAILVIISIVSLIFVGFNLDTDFAGGMAVTYKIESKFTTEDVTKTVADVLGKAPTSVQASGDEVVVKFGYDNNLKTDAEKSDYALGKLEEISKALNEKYGSVVETNKDVISPSTGKELASNALWMSILSVILILIYITFRFEFVSGVVAVLCLAHDVLLLCGIYSILNISIDVNFIAAVLTVLGYSINNTIVIFDRIRENTRHAKKQTYAEIANNSVNQTLFRSLNTTITTLLTIGMVYIMGVTSIKAFAMPIIIGILVGTYSSIFVAGSIWSMWRDSAVKAKKN
ncbi:MAG: protein translocase subunit SecF [Clostridia bacterium]|nr:protein translocase subunit SecF [Clostridia bacterium]